MRMNTSNVFYFFNPKDPKKFTFEKKLWLLLLS